MEWKKMKRKTIRALEFLGGLLLLAVMLVCVPTFAQAEKIKMGGTIDKSNYQQYESLLTENMLQAVKSGDWTYHTGDLKFEMKHSDRFLKASEQNAGKFDVNAQGWLIDKSTGKYPAYNVYGLPFPTFDPKQPDAGAKVMWNFAFQMYRFMGIERELNVLHWLRRNASEDRISETRSFSLYFQGRPPGQEIKDNPQKLLMANMSLTMAPMDARGSGSMTWEYKDETDSTVFSYIPSVRRVKRGSGAVRSDPFLGSDLWADSQNGFSGKNVSFTWKLLGERTILYPLTSLEKQRVAEGPDGSLSTASTPIMKYGFQTPGWKGATWAMTNNVWIPREVWVVEGYPKDPYYTFGKHIFYVDKKMYSINQADVYDKAGERWYWTVVTMSTIEGPSGNNCYGSSSGSLTMDLKKAHATTARTHPVKLYLPVQKLAPSFFTLNNFLQLSK